ncbi:MAG: hypothetical protein PHI27_13190 [Eubacteriales bacterium]|nr:hypothetical protein [Eubacteriales bacterium]MDD3883177.1 hypothetical protein [Eubacteriales bacterium]MDD4513352.1 hypothetical protein [Eubacteriales bacterium]
MKLQIESNIVKYILRNAYFINGTAYAGKSTMVRLLSEKYGGLMCGENYHDALRGGIDSVHQPALSYFETMSGWQEFISRSPREYTKWLDDGSREAADLELMRLVQLSAQGKKLFVDTNISPEILREISDYSHVAIMLSPQSMSVERFFDRNDSDKQFILSKINEAPDPKAAMDNYRECLKLINSREVYDEFAACCFFTYIRDESSTIEGALAAIERHFGLA